MGGSEGEEDEEDDHFVGGRNARETFICPGEWYRLVWGREEPIHEAWIAQDWKFIGLGVCQLRNGPCGVLAACNAVLLSRLLEREGEIDDIRRLFTAEELVDALCWMVERCTDEDTIRLPVWKNVVGPDVELIELRKGQEAREWMMENEDVYFGQGSIVLLIYAMVFTRGVERIKQDLVEADNEESLVVGPFWLCSFELLLLLLYGKAHGNVTAFDREGKKHNLPPSNVGMLLLSEVETGMSLCDSLKHPHHPIWILHGGDHFTLLFDAGQQELKGCFDLTFWNGLPPAQGFQMIRVFSDEGPCGKSPESQYTQWYKPSVGEIDEVIQAHAHDREKTEYYSQWRFEVILAVDDPEVKGSPRPAEQREEYPIFDCREFPLDDQEPWRCATCYRSRYKTMCFGMNEPGAKNCVHCGRSQLEAGWTFFVPYKSLPKPVRKHIQKSYDSKILNIIRTRWPDATVKFENPDKPPSC